MSESSKLYNSPALKNSKGNDVNNKPDMSDIITAKHWTPDHIDNWNHDGDLRERVLKSIEEQAGGDRAVRNPLYIEPAIVMDEADPDPVVVLTANWFHCDCHGVMTEDIFRFDLSETIAKLAEMIVEDRKPFMPVRLYKEANPAYGVGFFDWAGDEYPFDIRAIVQFGTWEFSTDKKDTVTSSGYQFHINTLCIPDKQDVDVHVGRDWGKQFDS